MAEGVEALTEVVVEAVTEVATVGWGLCPLQEDHQCPSEGKGVLTTNQKKEEEEVRNIV